MAPQSLDLELRFRWFTETPPAFPTTSMRALGVINADYTWSFEEDFLGGQDSEFIGAIQWLDDMSITKVRVTWNSRDVSGTLKAWQKRLMAPPSLTDTQLQDAHEWYGKHIVSWCKDRVGTTVGDGECWTLAEQALRSVAEDAISEGHEPPMVSSGKVHGQCILEYSTASAVPTDGLLELAGVKPGDVLQMENGHFKSVTHNHKFNTREEKNVRLKDHTAIVVGVEGETMRLVEQNTVFEKMTVEGDFCLGDMMEGVVRVFRPVGRTSTLHMKGICQRW